MLTGFNTDVRFEETLYHVQSEDRGAANPILDTLIYCGGQILDQVKTNYRILLGESASENAVARLLEEQHREVVRRVRQGHYAELRALASDTDADDGIEPALTAALETGEGWETLTLAFVADTMEGAVRGTLRVQVADGPPAGGARVTGRLVGVGVASAPVFDAETADDGSVAVHIALPETSIAAVVFSAERGPGGGRLRVDLAPVPARG